MNIVAIDDDGNEMSQEEYYAEKTPPRPLNQWRKGDRFNAKIESINKSERKIILKAACFLGHQGEIQAELNRTAESLFGIGRLNVGDYREFKITEISNAENPIKASI